MLDIGFGHGQDEFVIHSYFDSGALDRKSVEDSEGIKVVEANERSQRAAIVAVNYGVFNPLDHHHRVPSVPLLLHRLLSRLHALQKGFNRNPDHRGYR